MRIIAVSGYKNSGKSTLCRALLAEFAKRGLRAGYIKRTQEFVGSPPHTDSGMACAQGMPTLLWGDGSFRYELLPEKNTEDAYEVAGKFFPDADVVVLEGGKNMRLPKIWVLKEDETPPDDIGIFAIYDRHGPGDGASRYGADDTERLVSGIVLKITAEKKKARVYIGGRELPMKDFLADFISGGITGMLGALKKQETDGDGDIRIYLS